VSILGFFPPKIISASAISPGIWNVEKIAIFFERSSNSANKFASPGEIKSAENRPENPLRMPQNRPPKTPRESPAIWCGIQRENREQTIWNSPGSRFPVFAAFSERISDFLYERFSRRSRMIAQAISGRASWAILEPLGAILREILPQKSPRI